MSQDFSEDLWGAARNEEVPETYRIWGKWSIQKAIDQEEAKYAEDNEYGNAPTKRERAEFRVMQSVLTNSDTLEETLEELNNKAETYESQLERNENVENLENTSEYAPDTIPELYKEILVQANQEFINSMNLVEEYEAKHH